MCAKEILCLYAQDLFYAIIKTLGGVQYGLLFYQ